MCIPGDPTPGSSHPLSEVAQAVGGRLLREEDGQVLIASVHGLSGAIPGCLSYVESDRALGQALASPCAALLVPRGVLPHCPAIECANPRLAFALALRLFHPEDRRHQGVHPTACVSASARVAESATVGPFASIGEGTTVGEDAFIEAACRIGRGCRVGAGTRLRPQVVVGDAVHIGRGVTVHPRAVLGASSTEGLPPDMAPLLEIGDDVEIGARVSMEGGAQCPTRIGAGTKVDNLVHVGHGAQVGRHCILVGHASVEPLVTLGDYSVMAGQCVVTQGIRTGPQAVVGSRSVVVADLAPKSMVSGDPARGHRDELRRELALQRLPDFARRLALLESPPLS